MQIPQKGIKNKQMEITELKKNLKWKHTGEAYSKNEYERGKAQ